MIEERYLIFEIGKERFAIALADAAEIMELPAVYPLPKAPFYYRGMINVHNRPVPLLDLALKRGNEPSEKCGEVLVIGGKNVNLALLVDRVVDIVAGAFPVEAATDGDCLAEKRLILADTEIKLIEPERLLQILELEMNG